MPSEEPGITTVPRRRTTAVLAVVGALALLGSACSSDPVPVYDFARVDAGVVIQTVAAPARIEPEGRVEVTAPTSGKIAELLVVDGDQVTAGQPLLRLASSAIDVSIAQARAAVDAAGALAGVSTGVDLSPLIAGVRGQLEAVLPDVLASLADQANVLPEGELREGALKRLAEATMRYEGSRRSLLAAEHDAEHTADDATASQRAAAEAQRDQAQVALDAAQGRAEDLTVMAPADGVIELGRAGGSTGGLSAGDLAGGLGGGGGLGDVEGLLGGSGGAQPDGPIAVGATITAGATLLTVFDLGGFHARVLVDEVDAVDVAAGQRATILVDAFPDAELAGRVERIAIAPDRGDTGGVIFPVTVTLVEVPGGARLRVGLTASAEIQVRRIESDTVVPSAALLRRGGQEVVFVDRGGVAVQVPVTVAAFGDDTAAIDGEVEAGERVVTTGVEDLADGDPLT